jgi:hypothetical protein
MHELLAACSVYPEFTRRGEWRANTFGVVAGSPRRVRPVADVSPAILAVAVVAAVLATPKACEGGSAAKTCSLRARLEFRGLETAPCCLC